MIELKKYSRLNKAHKFAAPSKADALRYQSMNAKPASGSKPLFMPMIGIDYNYGLACIKECHKYRPGDVREPGEIHYNPRGWVLPGGVFTSSPDLVVETARKMDRYMLAGGGLPTGWVEMIIRAQQMREAA